MKRMGILAWVGAGAGIIALLVLAAWMLFPGKGGELTDIGYQDSNSPKDTGGMPPEGGGDDKEDLQEGDAEVGSYTSITMEEAREIFKTPGEYLIVDVRREEEYAQGHIPGAIRVTNEEITEEAPSQLPDKEQVIYVYCRSGRRSKEAAGKLAAMGYHRIVEFGGILDWQGEIEK